MRYLCPILVEKEVDFPQSTRRILKSIPEIGAVKIILEPFDYFWTHLSADLGKGLFAKTENYHLVCSFYDPLNHLFYKTAESPLLLIHLLTKLTKMVHKSLNNSLQISLITRTMSNHRAQQGDTDGTVKSSRLLLHQSCHKTSLLHSFCQKWRNPNDYQGTFDRYS